MVYCCVGCRDCTLLPYAIRSLQGYPGKLVQSSGMDITMDDVLTILDEHYNNVKALDTLSQGAIPTMDGRQRNCIRLGWPSPGFGCFLSQPPSPN